MLKQTFQYHVMCAQWRMSINSHQPIEVLKMLILRVAFGFRIICHITF